EGGAHGLCGDGARVGPAPARCGSRRVAGRGPQCHRRGRVISAALPIVFQPGRDRAMNEDTFMPTPRVVLIKPSKAAAHGSVERFRRGFRPNSTLPHLASLTPPALRSTHIEVQAIDEYVETDLDYLRWLRHDPEVITLVALIGVQSHQFHRALDLAA